MVTLTSDVWPQLFKDFLLLLYSPAAHKSVISSGRLLEGDRAGLSLMAAPSLRPIGLRSKVVHASLVDGSSRRCFTSWKNHESGDRVVGEWQAGWLIGWTTRDYSLSKSKATVGLNLRLICLEFLTHCFHAFSFPLSIALRPRFSEDLRFRIQLKRPLIYALIRID